MSEMALIILRTRAQQHQWPVSVYPGKIKLPSDIFHNLPSPKIAQIVARRTFLPDEADWVKQLGKKAAPVVSRGTTPSTDIQRRQPAEPRSPREREPRERKRKARATNGPKAQRKKRRSSGRDLTEDEESEESEIESDEDESVDEAATSSDDDEMDGAEAEAVMGRGGRRSAKVSVGAESLGYFVLTH